MHQLYGLEEHPEFPPLDSQEFGHEVRTLLARLPDETPGEAGAETRHR